MDVATRTTISRLLDHALDVPPEARPAWIDALPAEYDAVKPRLRVLLARGSSLDRASFLATLPKFAAPETGSGEEHEPARAGALVGPYRLLRILDSGGQGSVWLAERADGLLTRPVAVKLPHGLAFRPGLADRMARERNLLAALTHPHIARLYDAGVSAAGEPFLALEFVEGLSIDHHAADHQLDTAARVRLFQQVVGAVAFAHGRLVIHRDLKPSNILVTTGGEVRLLDFGIATLLGDEAVDSTLTRESGRAMTLAYASPEQVGQQVLGVASDVYSLGVVLFELLTGVRPYVPARESAAALEEAVLTQEARRASDAASGQARRALAGDLDTILAKALKKDPAARYATAGAFGDDLARWLDGRPVLAQPDSRTYRLRKFVWRHRVGVAASIALGLAILAGFVGTAAGVVRARQAEADARAAAEDARRQARTSDRVSRFLVDLFGAAKPEEQGGTEVTARQMLDRGAEKVRTELDDEPLVQARLLRTMSDAYSSLARYPDAATLASEAISVARAAGPSGEQELVKALTAAALTRRRVDDVTSAEQALREALATTQRIDPGDLDSLSRIYNELALLLRVREPDESLSLYRQAHDIIVQRHGPDHADAGLILANIGSGQSRQRRYAEAKGTLEQALLILTKHFGDADSRTATVLGNLAVVEKELGHHDRAIELGQRDLEVTTRTYGPRHPNVGVAALNLGRSALRAGEERLARAQIDQALSILNAHFSKGHSLILTSRNTKAQLLVRAGHTSEARALLEDSVRVVTDNAAAQSAQLAARLQLAELDRRLGRHATAIALTQSVLDDPVAVRDVKLAVDATWLMACVHATKGDDSTPWRHRALARQAADAKALPFEPLVAQARHAACAADHAATLRLLQEAAAAGFADRSIVGDPAFAALRGDPAFTELASLMGQ